MKLLLHSCRLNWLPLECTCHWQQSYRIDVYWDEYNEDLHTVNLFAVSTKRKGWNGLEVTYMTTLMK